MRAHGGNAELPSLTRLPFTTATWEVPAVAAIQEAAEVGGAEEAEI